MEAIRWPPRWIGVTRPWLIRLVAAGANPNRHEYGPPPLALAVREGLLAASEALIRAGADVNGIAPNLTLNQRAIHEQAAASVAGFADFVRRALEGGDSGTPTPPRRAARVERITVRNCPFPVLAACVGHAEILRRLLGAGANPHAKDGKGVSAWGWARHLGHEPVLAVLREFEVTGDEDVRRTERLLAAAEAGNLPEIEAALAAGADVNGYDERAATRGQTTLILAARRGLAEAVRRLLAAGADPNRTDRRLDAEGVPRGIVSMVDDPEEIASMGYFVDRSALSWAAAGGRPEIAEILLAAGADARAADLLGATPLRLACKKGSFEVARLLLDHGVAAKAGAKGMKIALAEAVRAGSTELVRLLLNHGVTMERAILNTAIEGIFERDESLEGRRKMIRMLELLFAAGAKDALGKTDPALHTAAALGLEEVVKFLLARGLPADARNREGHTAADMARFGGHRALAKLLNQAAKTPDLPPAGENIEPVEQSGEGAESVGEGDPADDDDLDAEEPIEEEDRWGPEIERPDFSARGDARFREAVSELAARIGAKVDFDPTSPGTARLDAPSSPASPKLEDVQREFLPRGIFVFSEHHREPVIRWRVLPTADRYEAIAWRQTHGGNYGIGTGYIIEWLKELETQQPFVLTEGRERLGRRPLPFPSEGREGARQEDV